MIGYYRAEIARLQVEKQRFINLQNGLSGKVVPNINKCNSTINSATNQIKEGYTIDGESADGQEVEIVNNKLEEISTKITGSVIPAIDAEISRINAEIARLEALIAEELRRIAEAEAAAAAAAASSKRGGR
ncbi:MAG: hypothetical protein ACI33S_03195 [Bacilli bacterium]